MTEAKDLLEFAARVDDETLLGLARARIHAGTKLEVLFDELELRYRARGAGLESARQHVQLAADFINTLSAPTVTGLLESAEERDVT